MREASLLLDSSTVDEIRMPLKLPQSEQAFVTAATKALELWLEEALQGEDDCGNGARTRYSRLLLPPDGQELQAVGRAGAAGAYASFRARFKKTSSCKVPSSPIANTTPYTCLASQWL